MAIWFLKQLLAASGLVKNAFADTLNGSISLYDPFQGASFAQIVDKLVSFLLTIGVPIAVVMVIVGGFQMLVSGGNPEKVSSGKKTIIYAAIGLAVILAAKSLIVIIKSILGVS